MALSNRRLCAGFIFVLALAAPLGRGQTRPAAERDIEALKKTAPRVYIDCGSCDLDYIKTEVTFVNYVRDRKEAQIHVLITTQSTGSEGLEYKLHFLGQAEFAGTDDTIQFFSNKTDTTDEIRAGLVRALKTGLAGYAARTPIASRLVVEYSAPPQAGPGVDPWKNWVFSLSSQGYFSGEQSTASSSWGLNASANRVTAAMKLKLGLSANFQHQRFDYEGETIRSNQDSYSFNGLYVKALGEHWSAGFVLDVESSIYHNLRFSVQPGPAVEFNAFPYSESARRQLRFLYKVLFTAVRYREETIDFKTRQNLLSHALSATLDMKEKWGSVSTTLSGSQYFFDPSKYRVALSGMISLNLIKGLSVFVLGGGSWIHDQINLVRGAASLEQILLQTRELETGYNYFVMVGASFTFGSVFTNVVNPRFGSFGGSGVIIGSN